MTNQKQISKLVKLSLLSSVMAVSSLGMAQAAEYKMKIANSDPYYEDRPDHYVQTPLLAFEKEVEEKSNGAIEVEIFYNGQLGKIENVLNLVRNGQVEMAFPSDGHLSPYYADIQVLGIPYLFITRDVAYEVLDGELGDYFAENMAKEVQIRPLGFLENGGYRNFTANSPINSPADMQGMKIRTMSNPVHMEIVKSLGASPTPVAWEDLYTALQTGVVDGEENALSTFRTAHLEEVQSNIIMDGHVYSPLVVAVSEQWYSALPEDLQDVVQTAADNFVKMNRELSVKNEQSDREYLESKGTKIVDPSIEVKQEFQNLTQAPAIELVKEQVKPETLEITMKAVGEAQAKVTGN